MNWATQVWSFVGRIEPHDLVVLPLKMRSAIAVGRASGDYEYRPQNPPGARHVRPVDWIRDDIPRTAFDQDLLFSLGAFLTVCQIKRNNAEERIRAVVEGKPAPAAGTPSDLPVEDDTSETVDLAAFAQDQIRTFIGQRFKGHDLSRLVDEILQVQGYRTELSPPGPDGGVDIIGGKGAMGFEAPRLVVQVKSSESPVDVRVLRELQGVMRNFGADRGLLVSWGGFKTSVYNEARKLFFEIRLWDADDLIEALAESYGQLPDDLQAELPLKRVWALVLEE
jgi:restriction system protein